MPGGIVGHGRRRPRPGARPRARAVALDWGISSQRFRGEFTQQLHHETHSTLAAAQTYVETAVLCLLAGVEQVPP